MDNNNYLNNKSHNLKLLALVAALLIITPLVSTPLRLKYLYFIVNILIIAVGADAGLLSFLLQSANRKKPVVEKVNVVTRSDKPVKNLDKTVGQKCSTDKTVNAIEVAEMKKSPLSSPSIFFIEGSETAPVDESGAEDEKGESDGGDSSNEEEELFEKAETFIGNFYKQLKMQREESWKNLLDDLSQKA